VSLGIVKWFRSDRRYGFIQPDTDDGSGDVFVSENLLAELGIDSLTKGQPVRFEAARCRKGLRAVALTIL
jgi:CspA family cold shock protein